MRQVPAIYRDFVSKKQKQFYRNMLVSLSAGMLLELTCQQFLHYTMDGHTDWMVDLWSCGIYGVAGVALALLTSFATILAPSPSKKE